MKILVSTKRTPDPDAALRIAPDGRGIVTDGVAFVMNPFDAIALEEALRIREGGAFGAEVLSVGIGGAEYEDILRTALAMGADRALLVESEAHLDSWNVARVLAEVVSRERPELVLMGKQAIDDDANQAGQFLAAMLDWPQATFASRIELLDGQPRRARVQRETDLGLEQLLLSLPAVVTADLRLNEPRYASLPSLMKARRKPIERIGLEDLGVKVERRIELVGLSSTSVRRACRKVADAAELVELLRTEARVI